MQKNKHFANNFVHLLLETLLIKSISYEKGYLFTSCIAIVHCKL